MDAPRRRYTLRRCDRVRATRDIQRIFREGKVAPERSLIVRAIPNGTERSRIVAVVSRKVGNAVARNRARRLVREAFRLYRHRWPPGLDVAISPRPGVRLSLALVTEELGRALGRIAHLYRTRPDLPLIVVIDESEVDAAPPAQHDAPGPD